MLDLKLLKFYMPKHFDDLGIFSKVHLLQGIQYLWNELRYFHWHRYSLKILPLIFVFFTSLPLNFIQECLIALNLPHNKEIEQL